MAEASSSSSSSSSSSCSSPRAAPSKQIAVRGVPLSASEEDLRNHFERYGEVDSVEERYWMRGYSDVKQAFIYFADSASANRASASREKNNHIIVGKLVEVCRYSVWHQGRTIEVYNLPPGTTNSQFRTYFEEFGAVVEAGIGPDSSGYVFFKLDESVRKLLKKKLHLFYGTELKVRRESKSSRAFLVANAAQHESTSSATPTRPVYTNSTLIDDTPYVALYMPSYNRPTTDVPHAYSAPSISPYDVPSTSLCTIWSTNATPHESSAPTPPLGTDPYTSSDNQPISVTTHAYRAPSISPYDVPSTSLYNIWPTTATLHESSPPIPSFGTDPYTPPDNRPISATTYACGAPSISRPYGVPSAYWSTTTTPHLSSIALVDVETRTVGPSTNSSNNANVSNSKKIFVGGLPRDTTYDEFRAFFRQFGPITKAYVSTYKNIDKTQGFGFVTFETEKSAHEVLKNQFYEMKPDKRVEVKKAIEGNKRCNDDNNNNGASSSNIIIHGHQETRKAEPSRNSSSNADVPNDNRIFVRGLPTYITDDELRAHFEKFGQIIDAYIVRDKVTKRHRGFGFVTFETKESADEVLKNHLHEMMPDKKVEVKKAIPKIEGNIRCDNNNDHNGVSGSNNKNINNNGGKYNPGIRKFPPDENGNASIHKEL